MLQTAVKKHSFAYVPSTSARSCGAYAFGRIDADALRQLADALGAAATRPNMLPDQVDDVVTAFMVAVNIDSSHAHDGLARVREGVAFYLALAEEYERANVPPQPIVLQYDDVLPTGVVTELSVLFTLWCDSI